MTDLPQRWLTGDAMCSLLSISRDTLKDWVRKKYLVRIGATKRARYLDPGPEYAERLRIHRAHVTNLSSPKDVTLANLISTQEVADIMGWSIDRTRHYLFKRGVKGFKRARHNAFYPIQEVRNVLWRFNGRKKASKRGPLLLKEVIAFFWKHYEDATAIMPTDAEFIEDDLLAKKIRAMLSMPSPQKEVAVREFMANIELAKKLVAVYKSGDQQNS